ncbi:hypothetical protein FISHEDRAFT_65496 [Fistulina hepatica ATCC 64428]|nr:hypothetical protein FISHEDRAFT_65496 [Fistulina hepatica ATCC 64428]
MENDFFSVEAILAENQKVQCFFKTDIPEMGHLGGGSERHIRSGAKLQIPIWLAYTVIYSNWADFAIPTVFGARVRNALKAEARSVQLSSLVGAGGMWYSFGKTIMDILTDEQGNEMSEMLTLTFRRRLQEVVDQAQHFATLGPAGGGGGGPSGHPQQAFREGLDGLERELFMLAQESVKRTKKWYEEGARR